MLSREVSTLECVYHPFILRLFEVIETLGKIHLISEWIQGGELYNRITEVGPLKEPHAALLFQQLLLAVKHLHSLGFVHRDIKAENVLLVSEERIKLADFGFSTQLVNGPWQHLDTFCGSPPYAAPELFSDDHYIGGPVDVWALGILLYFMLEGGMPFKAPTVPLLRTAVLKGEFVISTSLSLPCCRVIQRILVHTPSRRPTIEQLLECQWFKYAADQAAHTNRNNGRQQSPCPKTGTANNQTRNGHVPRRRKKLFWFLPLPVRDRLSSPESGTSRDNLSAANHHHHPNHHNHSNNQRNVPRHSQRHQRPLTVSSATKSSSSRDEPPGGAAEVPPQPRTLACNTKRAASVLEEGFLHPLKLEPATTGDGTAAIGVADHIKDVTNDVSNNNISSSYNSNSTNHYNGADQPANGHGKEVVEQRPKPRRFSFGRTLKKRIGPMELVSTESLAGGPETAAGVGGGGRTRALDLREKLHRTIDEEHGKFVMYPTTAVSSEGDRHLHALEAETRRLMNLLGINGDMMARAVANGPRSDIIGVYRIIMHRLQREQAHSRLAAAAAANGSAFEFLELKPINVRAGSGASSGGGRSKDGGGGGTSANNSPPHIGQNRGRTMCAIL
ncbi:probable serine/threonine-protein kinase MARK-A [Anopheles cruzii]|uniref:probable serine/threonine-protein kinase MARK-A n=1 Tax=Anopheles cruzii TaxID=68878 RepID=UPI0022EC6370|nr:probable serine/threonine-protein kinase MARK-A [Anopheles cruzii]